MNARTVLITGANGFVGAHLSRALNAGGSRVHGTGLGAPSGGLALEAWHVADVCDPGSLEAALAASRPDVVVHLAGQSSAAFSFEDPAGTFRVNALGTWNLLEAVRKVAPGTRVLVIGSGESYGPQPEGTRVPESGPFRPVSPYALSKGAADAFADVAGRVNGLDVVRTRSFAHAGPGQSPHFALPSFAQQIAEIEASRAEPVLRVGNLEVTRDITDVRDVAAAYVALIERGKTGAAYNVCSGRALRMSEITAHLVSRAQVPIRIEVDRSRFRPADVPYLVGDVSAIRRDCGWQATTPVERILDDLLADWRGRKNGS